MSKRAALILAGGSARRFQTIDKTWQDKALAKLEDKPLLVHAVEAVKDIVDETVVCVNDALRKEKYAQILSTYGLPNAKIVVDERVPGIRGPNVAILTGLKATQADFCLTLPCDMPFLKPQVAEYLFEQADGFDVAVPMWPDGRLETLLMTLERKAALEIVQTLCSLKRPRSDDIFRGANKVLLLSPMNHIKMLDPDLQSFVNINSREDLNKLPTRSTQGAATQTLKLKLGIQSTSDLQQLQKAAVMLEQGRLTEAQDAFGVCADNLEVSKSYFWAAVSGENQGEALRGLAGQQSEPQKVCARDFEGKAAFLRAANNYRLEAQVFGENRCRLLEERALADKAWCESGAIGKTEHIRRYPSKIN